MSKPAASPLYDAALTYAAQGLPVLPLWWPSGEFCTCPSGPSCTSPGKHPFGPLVPHGLKDATIDPETIKSWWGEFPRANVGIVAGHEHAIIILDIDPRHDGDKSLSRLESEYSPLPDTLRARTGSDGQHVYMSVSTDILPRIRNKAGVGPRVKNVPEYPGLDIRASDGFAVAPPSRHVSGRTYKWDRSTTTIEPAPQWLIDLIISPEPTAREKIPDGWPPYPPVDLPPEGGTKWGLAALQGEYDRIVTASPGQRRSTILTASFKVAQIVAAGQLASHVAERTIYEACAILQAHAPKDEPLGDAEIKSAVSSAWEAGLLHPRGPKDKDMDSKTILRLARGEKADTANAKNGDEQNSGTQSGDKAKPDTGETAPPPLIKIFLPTFSDLAKDPPQPPPSIVGEAILVARTVGMLHAEPKSYKTYLAAQMAVCVASSRPWLGHAIPEARPVVYLSLEGGISLIYQRIAKMVETWGLDRAAQDKIHIWDMRNSTWPAVDDAHFVFALIDALIPLAPGLVVIDPLAEAHTCDENSSKDMIVVRDASRAIAEKTGAAVLIVHHSRKADPKARGPSGNEARGTSALYGMVSSMISVAPKRIKGEGVDPADGIQITYSLRWGPSPDDQFASLDGHWGVLTEGEKLERPTPEDKAERVYSWLADHPHSTRAEVEQGTGLPTKIVRTALEIRDRVASIKLKGQRAPVYILLPNKGGPGGGEK